jgi:heme/copper-type cytochrome/quinol oxidase subunit 2
MSARLIIAQIEFFPNQASHMAGQVDLLLLSLTVVTGSVTFGVAVVIMYFLAKYRKRAAADRTPPKNSSLPVETTWTVIPFFIFIAFFVWGAKSFSLNPSSQRMQSKYTLLESNGCGNWNICKGNARLTNYMCRLIGRLNC